MKLWCYIPMTKYVRFMRNRVSMDKESRAALRIVDGIMRGDGRRKDRLFHRIRKIIKGKAS